MVSFKNPNPISSRPSRDRTEDDVSVRTKERHNGADIDVTYYKDGSSKVHWGGPCGSTSYDEYGEEC